MKSHGDEVTDFYDKEILNRDPYHTCLILASLDFVLKEDESYYQQVFFKECKYVKKKVVRHILLVALKVLLMILMILMKNELKI